MKRIASITAYLTVMGTLAVAQPPAPSPTDDSQSPAKIRDSQVATPDVQPSGEFVPLNNVPFFSGGNRALEEYIEALDPYPYVARQAQAEGTVRVGFRVLASGELTNVRVVQSREPLLNRAAVLAVSNMPHWYPAHRAGTAVSCPVELAITFRLD